MTPLINCCKDCKDRFPACHDSCQIYISQKQEWEAVKKKLADFKGSVISPGEYEEIRYSSCKRHKKRYRR